MKKKIIILLLLVLFVSLIGCAKNDPKVVSINNRIEELNNIQDNRESILEIINIKEEIKLLSDEQVKWVKTKQLNSISYIVLSRLKDSVAWEEYLSREIDYVFLSDFVVFSNIVSISFFESIISSHSPYYIYNKDYISIFINIINIPLSLVTNFSDCSPIFKKSINVNLEKVKVVFIEFGDTDKDELSLWFRGGWFYFSITENDEEKYYVSLFELTEEQLNSLFDLSELVRKGYIQLKR